MPLNLDSAKTFLEGEMSDVVLVTRDSSGYRDDTFNKTTGVHTPSAESTIWNGKAMIIPVTADPTKEPEGGGDGRYTRYTIMLPLDCPPIAVFDNVELLDSFRDDDLVGSQFTIQAVEASTFAVSRVCFATRRDFRGNR